jgi:hypothetical protein
VYDIRQLTDDVCTKCTHHYTSQTFSSPHKFRPNFGLIYFSDGRYKLFPLHLPLVDPLNTINNCRRLQMTKALIIRFSLASCDLLFKSTYSPHHHVLSYAALGSSFNMRKISLSNKVSGKTTVDISDFHRSPRRTAWSLRMGPILCPETSITKYQPTPRNFPEERRSRNYNLWYFIFVPFSTVRNDKTGCNRMVLSSLRFSLAYTNCWNRAKQAAETW